MQILKISNLNLVTKCRRFFIKISANFDKFMPTIFRVVKQISTEIRLFAYRKRNLRTLGKARLVSIHKKQNQSPPNRAFKSFNPSPDFSALSLSISSISYPVSVVARRIFKPFLPIALLFWSEFI